MYQYCGCDKLFETQKAAKLEQHISVSIRVKPGSGRLAGLASEASQLVRRRAGAGGESES